MTQNWYKDSACRILPDSSLSAHVPPRRPIGANVSRETGQDKPLKMPYCAGAAIRSRGTL